MNIKEIFFYGLRLFIIYTNDEIKIWNKLEDDTKEKRRVYYNEIVDDQYEVINNELILSDNLKFNLNDVYNESYLLFKKKYYEENSARNYRIWNAKLLNDSYIELHFEDKSIGIFYLKEFLKINKIDEILSFDIKQNKLIINGFEISNNFLYANCFKYKLEKCEWIDVDISLQPRIKNFKWISDNSNEMLIKFSNSEIGIYDFNKLLFSERNSKNEMCIKLKNNMKFLHKNLCFDSSSFSIKNTKEFPNELDDIIVIGFLSEEPVYFDSKIMTHKSNFMDL